MKTLLIPETKAYYDITEIFGEYYCFTTKTGFGFDIIKKNSVASITYEKGMFVVTSKPVKWWLDTNHTQAMKGHYNYRRHGKLMYCKLKKSKGLLIEKIC